MHLKQDVQQTTQLGDIEGAEMLKGELHGEEVELSDTEVLLFDIENDI